MKKIWNGTLSFSLVTIPVVLYPAVKEHILGFKLLCARCHTPISYQRFCEHCDKPVAWNEVVKGLKLPDGSYFVITPEKLKELKQEKLDEIKIIEFVARAAIDPIYFEHHYYLAPASKGQSSFNLFCAALHVTNTAAIAAFVMRDKEHICAISFYQGGLLLTTLNYAYEIVSTKGLFTTAVAHQPSAAELRLATELIRNNTVKKFDITMFKDTFAQKLAHAIAQQQKGTKSLQPISKKAVKKPEESLVNLLKASIEQPKPAKTAAKKAKKR